MKAFILAFLISFLPISFAMSKEADSRERQVWLTGATYDVRERSSIDIQPDGLAPMDSYILVNVCNEPLVLIEVTKSGRNVWFGEKIWNALKYITEDDSIAKVEVEGNKISSINCDKGQWSMNELDILNVGRGLRHD